MMGSPFRGKRASGEGELNLTPVMDLFTTMIPFLLMSAAFFQISIINASVPTISDGPLEPGQSEKVMNILLRVDNQGYHIMGNGENVTMAELNSVRATIPKIRRRFDIQTLTAVLGGIKWRFPRGKTVVMVPDPGIPYETIISTMDAARWGLTETSGTNAGSRKLLYPSVVLSSVEKETS